MEFIDLKTQYRNYKKEINDAIQEVLDSSQYINGPQVRQLEEKLAEFIGVNHCIGASSGTDTLLIALLALGIGQGDEVITVPFTWISTAQVISLLGARPVFVDIDEETFNIDVKKIEQAVTPRTKALLPVNLFGQMADYTAINAIARKYNLPVIEDAAQSFGAEQKGKMSCGVTTFGSTSFFPAKTLGCYGDGGALFTNDAELAAKCRALRNHGSEERHNYQWVGINGRLDTLQAAILLAKFAHFKQELVLREEIGRRYSAELADVCITPKVAEGNTHVYSIYTIRVENRQALCSALEKEGIPAPIYYPRPLHLQPVYQYLGYQEGDFPVCEKVAGEVLSLPMHPWLQEQEQEKIIHTVRKYAAVAI